MEYLYTIDWWCILSPTDPLSLYAHGFVARQRPLDHPPLLHLIVRHHRPAPYLIGNSTTHHLHTLSSIYHHPTLNVRWLPSPYVTMYCKGSDSILLMLLATNQNMLNLMPLAECLVGQQPSLKFWYKWESSQYSKFVHYQGNRMAYQFAKLNIRRYDANQ